MPVPADEAAAASNIKISDRVYELIKDWIMRGKLLPGERLQPQELARHLNASTTPVKEALQRLAGEDFVEITPRRGVFVSQFSLRDVEELLEIRLLHETYAGEQAIARGISEDDLRCLESRMNTLEHLSRLKTLRRPDAFAQADRDFHCVIVGMRGNSQLAKIFEQLNLYLNSMRVYYFNNETRAKITTQEHRAIYDALVTRDPSRFRQAIEAHIRGVQVEFATYFTEHTERSRE